MYLSKKTYVQNWNHKKEKHEIIIKLNGKIRDDIKSERISYIQEEIAYWEKANHIHNWFVENIQGGIDNCKSYYVSKDDLKKLLKTCNKVNKSLMQSETIEKDEEVLGKNGKVNVKIKVFKNIEIAKKLLPTKEGFFFGGTDYDEYYLENIKYTIKIIEKILKELKTYELLYPEFYYPELYYHASW